MSSEEEADAVLLARAKRVFQSDRVKLSMHPGEAYVLKERDDDALDLCIGVIHPSRAREALSAAIAALEKDG